MLKQAPTQLPSWLKPHLLRNWRGRKESHVKDNTNFDMAEETTREIFQLQLYKQHVIELLRISKNMSDFVTKNISQHCALNDFLYKIQNKTGFELCT